MYEGGESAPKPRLPQAVRVEAPADSSRRKFLRLAAGAAVAGATVYAARSLGLLESPSANDVPSQDVAIASEKIAEKELINKTHLNEILNMDLKNPERFQLEDEYAASVKTLAQIDAGLWICVSEEARAELMARRALLRKEGKEGLKRLPREKIDWANERKINPEVLAICEDAYEEAVKVMRKLQDSTKFLNNVNPDDRLMSPGGMAELSRFESNFFLFIGDKYSKRVLNEPDQQDALSIIAHDLKLYTGLNFSQENIPSSFSGDIGVFQFRPTSALEVARDLAIVGVEMNPFDPKSGTVAAFIFMASKKYSASNSTKAEEALTAWNQKLGGKKEILQADIDYRTKFMKLGN